ncbi:hypothetical protein LIA77_01023 [Sarocladium implicatum]|nr:hypothetical protein LIA77_01023 [Sarocladium implicatum]
MIPRPCALNYETDPGVRNRFAVRRNSLHIAPVWTFAVWAYVRRMQTAQRADVQNNGLRDFTLRNRALRRQEVGMGFGRWRPSRRNGRAVSRASSDRMSSRELADPAAAC